MGQHGGQGTLETGNGGLIQPVPEAVGANVADQAAEDLHIVGCGPA
jgi:hypothetical protein